MLMVSATLVEIYIIVSIGNVSMSTRLHDATAGPAGFFCEIRNSFFRNIVMFDVRQSRFRQAWPGKLGQFVENSPIT